MAVITAEELRTYRWARIRHYKARVTSIHAAACARIKRYAADAPIEVRNESP